jgi:hypothetical protein
MRHAEPSELNFEGLSLYFLEGLSLYFPSELNFERLSLFSPVFPCDAAPDDPIGNVFVSRLRKWERPHSCRTAHRNATARDNPSHAAPPAVTPVNAAPLNRAYTVPGAEGGPS